MPNDGSSLPATSIASIDEAYRYLAMTTDYLMKREPHSPVPHLLRRAIEWRNKSTREVLIELMRAGADIETIYILLGLPQDDPSCDAY